MEIKPLLASSAIVRKGNAVLLVKRKYGPDEGKWALPGGHVKYGETVRDCALREVKEETNLDVKINKLLGVYDKISKDRQGEVKHHYGIVCFDTTYKGSRPRASEEIAELRWFKPRDIRKILISKTTEKALMDAGFLSF